MTIDVDFSDTPMGEELLERIEFLSGKIRDLEDEITELEQEQWKLQDEYDMHEEMFLDALDEEE